MTVTDVEHIRTRHREPRETVQSPESEQVAQLREWLTDPAHEQDWPDIEKAIVYLTATSVLAA